MTTIAIIYLVIISLSIRMCLMWIEVNQKVCFSFQKRGVNENLALLGHEGLGWL